jgi:antitoxin CptB
MTEPDHPAPRVLPKKDPGGAPHLEAPSALHDGGASHHEAVSYHIASDIRRRRLLFRATHRGTFENDLMIGGFVRAHLMNLTEADVDALEAVMEIQDTDLADWLTGRVPIPVEEETPMLRRMREFLAR